MRAGDLVPRDPLYPGAPLTGAQTHGWTMSGQPLDHFGAAMLLADFDYRLVAQTWMFTRTGVEIVVLTVFLVVDVEHTGTMPDLFETVLYIDGRMMKGPDFVASVFGYKVKTGTWDAALAEHLRHIDLFRNEGYRLGLPGVTSTEIGSMGCPEAAPRQRRG